MDEQTDYIKEVNYDQQMPLLSEDVVLENHQSDDMSKRKEKEFIHEDDSFLPIKDIDSSLQKAKKSLRLPTDTSFEYEENSDSEEESAAEREVLVEKPLLQKPESSTSLYLSCGFLWIIFVMSIILWVGLFADLTRRAHKISNVVEKTPTLEKYYEMYDDFYKQFYDAQKNLSSIEKELNLAENSEIKVFESNVQNALAANANMQSNLAKLEEDITNMKHSPYMEENVEALNEDYARLVEHVTNASKLKDSFQGFYTNIVKTLQELYDTSDKLLKLYGKFFVNTNRIWAATENIFVSYEQRAKEIIDEAIRNHYTTQIVSAKQVMLENPIYQQGKEIKELQSLDFTETESKYLLCTVRAEVNNENKQYADKELTLLLATDNSIANQNQFEYKFTERHVNIVFHQTLKIPAGDSSAKLYAKTINGDIQLESVNVQCFTFEPFKKIEEYETN